jgi:hypothetical protein
MRAWPLHVVFATILVGSLAAKERAADMLVDVDDLDRETAVMHVARSHGLVFREDVTLPGASIPALAFEAPGCSRPVLVVLRAAFDEEPLLRSVREQGYVSRYVYIDRSWEKPDRLAFFVERMKYAALATFSLTRYVPSGHLLLVASPPGCEIAAAIDWRNMWNRDYVAAAQADTRATGK